MTDPKTLRLCMNCKHFAISHPQANAEMTDSERAQFIAANIISHGVCTHPKMRITNYITGAEEFPYALVCRKSNSPDMCGPDGEYFEEIERISNEN